MFPRPLKILQTCFSHSWGGLEQQACEVSAQLQNRGHHVWLACCPGSRLQQEAQERSLNALPYRVSGYFHPLIWRQLSAFIKQAHVDIIHCQLSKDIATLVPSMLLARRSTPIVLSKRVGSYISKKDPFHRFTYRHVSRVLAISEVIRRNVLETTPMSPDRVRTIHDAIDTDLFSPSAVDRTRVRQEFGFAMDLIIIGFVGRFSPGKGHEEFLQAAQILHPAYPNVRFLIVGEASHGEEQYEEQIHRLCQQLGVGKVVKFAGFRTDIPQVMAAFDIFAFPSHAESFGVALIEAMAMERPVVSTNCDGVLDIVVEGETGIYVPPRNARELAEALARLIKDSVLRERMGKAGRKRVLALFDRKRQMETIEEVYYDLLMVPPQAGSEAQVISGTVPS